MSPKRPEDEIDEMEGQEEQQEEVVVQGKQGWLANAPWWLISVGIHAVLILGATLIAIEKLVAIDEGEVAVVVTAKLPIEVSSVPVETVTALACTAPASVAVLLVPSATEPLAPIAPTKMDPPCAAPGSMPPAKIWPFWITT